MLFSEHLFSQKSSDIPVDATWKGSVLTIPFVYDTLCRVYSQETARHPEEDSLLNCSRHRPRSLFMEKLVIVLFFGTESWYVAQDGPKCVIFLLQSPEYWDYRWAPIYQASTRHLNIHRLAHIHLHSASSLTHYSPVKALDWKDHTLLGENPEEWKRSCSPKMKSNPATATQSDAGALSFNPSLRQGWPNKEKGSV